MNRLEQIDRCVKNIKRYRANALRHQTRNTLRNGCFRQLNNLWFQAERDERRVLSRLLKLSV